MEEYCWAITQAVNQKQGAGFWMSAGPLCMIMCLYICMVRFMATQFRNVTVSQVGASQCFVSSDCCEKGAFIRVHEKCMRQGCMRTRDLHVEMLGFVL